MDKKVQGTFVLSDGVMTVSADIAEAQVLHVVVEW